jgi:hypothetical protein
MYFNNAAGPARSEVDEGLATTSSAMVEEGLDDHKANLALRHTTQHSKRGNMQESEQKSKLVDLVTPSK